jgi:NADH dehydrogenase
MKVMEGWLNTPKLVGFFGGAQAWYDSVLNGVEGNGDTDGISSATGAASDTVSGATGAASDAVSGATGAGEGAAQVGTVIFDFDFLGLFSAYFVSGKELAHSTLSDLAFKIDIPLLNWFIDTLILPNDSIQILMQSFIVAAEILIGLALIGGLFTFPAAGFSLILQAMFVTTTGLYLGTFWMIFAGVAVLIGAGRTFGLDYYAMPALKNAWKKLPIIRKSYLYHD